MNAILLLSAVFLGQNQYDFDQSAQIAANFTQQNATIQDHIPVSNDNCNSGTCQISQTPASKTHTISHGSGPVRNTVRYFRQNRPVRRVLFAPFRLFRRGFCGRGGCG